MCAVTGDRPRNGTTDFRQLIRRALTQSGSRRSRLNAWRPPQTNKAERRRIEQHDVPPPTAPGKTLQPVEHVAIDEIMFVGIEVVGVEIFAAPAEVGLAEIYAGCFAAARRH